MEWKFNLNEKSVSGKLKQIEDMAEARVKAELKNIADSLVEANISGKFPVDTGAYILSHTFKPTGVSGGRGYTSRGKPRGQDPATKVEQSRAQLYSEIDAADITSSRAGIFRNRAPHSGVVEQKYNVYRIAKDRAR